MFIQAEKAVADSTEDRHCVEVTLPPTNTVRWVASRKTSVLAAIDAGSLSIEEARLMYRLTIEELLLGRVWLLYMVETG